jgi:hypothetical protein
VGTLTYAVLRAAGALDRLEPSLRARLRERYRAQVALHLARMGELDRVLDAARAAGLPLVPLKGALLGRTHYGDPGAREMLDLDLLCPPEALEQATALIAALGFTAIAPDPARAQSGGTHDVKLVRGPTHIELHFRLWHELGIDPDPRPLLARAREVPFGGGRVLAPTAADHLYFVLVHAALHGFAGNPMWIPDALLLADEVGPSAWETVMARARRTGAELAVLAARDHLRGVLGGGQIVPGPGRLRRALLHRAAPWLQRGEPALGLWPSRLVRPLLFERPGPLLRWAAGKAALWAALKRQGATRTGGRS